MSDYWRKRQAEHIKMAMDTAEDSAIEIAKLYQKASFYLNEQIQGVFDKYRGRHGLSTVAVSYTHLNIVCHTQGIGLVDIGIVNAKSHKDDGTYYCLLYTSWMENSKWNRSKNV